MRRDRGGASAGCVCSSARWTGSSTWGPSTETSSLRLWTGCYGRSPLRGLSPTWTHSGRGRTGWVWRTGWVDDVRPHGLREVKVLNVVLQGGPDWTGTPAPMDLGVGPRGQGSEGLQWTTVGLVPHRQCGWALLRAGGQVERNRRATPRGARRTTVRTGGPGDVPRGGGGWTEVRVGHVEWTLTGGRGCPSHEPMPRKPFHHLRRRKP